MFCFYWMPSALGSQVYSQYVGTATQEWTNWGGCICLGGCVCVCAWGHAREKALNTVKTLISSLFVYSSRTISTTLPQEK